MSKPTDIRVVDANISFEPCPFRTPLKFGGRVMSTSRLINVQVTVESESGEHATGFGSMPVGNIWAWPSTRVEPDPAEKAMMDFAERALGLYSVIPESGHPIDLVFYVSAEYAHLGKTVSSTMNLPEPVPPLAQLVAASPIDAALHDAYGRLHGVNSYNALSAEFMDHDLAHYLDEQFADEYLDQYTLREPKARMPLYHLVGALDPLTPADVEKPVGDGLPETLAAWIAADGLTHLKIKLCGDDLDWDVGRVISVDDVAAEAQSQRGCRSWYYSTDFNEKCANEDYVLDFLDRIQERRPAAYDRIQYIEQPTHRDLKSHPQNTMRRAAARKPVVIDESLVDYEALILAREQGYSGVALKACKGHTEALFAAAAAQKFGMFLCVQDLTCPGFSFLHSASIAARVPSVAGIEGNGRQYCPKPNRKWARQFPSMFEITDGTVGTGVLTGVGLGF
ncbi:MAG: enolase C-terminal domain-like protein [Planctomycetaceae bacterium]